MVTPAVLLLLNLIHIILGTFGVAFLAIGFAILQDRLLTTPELAASRDLLLSAVVLAGVAWIISIIIGPLGAIAAKHGRNYSVRVSAGFAFVAFVLYAVAGSLAAYVYSKYPDIYLAGAAGLLLISAIILIAFGSSAIVLAHTVKVVVIETPSEAVVVPVVSASPAEGTLETLRPY